ncbi:MAG: hypothetical protein R8M45_08150 [Ghiorsea sp.]
MVFSKRYQKPRAPSDPNAVDWGSVASVLIVFSLLSFVTAWVYSFNTESIEIPDIYQGWEKNAALTGPIHSKKSHETYQIRVKAMNMPLQSWSYVEGQVLDKNKEYLFSFGKGLWNESGRDSEGYYWHEADDAYEISITLPQAGDYYLQFSAESNQQPEIIAVTVSKRMGSSLPHFWFGVLLLIAGVVLNEVKNRTMRKMVTAMNGRGEE